MSLLSSLESYWALDETSGSRADSHGTNTLTSNGGVGSATGKISNGADFEPLSSQYLSRASSASLQTGDIDFTFSFWFRLEVAATGYIIIGKDTDTPGSSRDYTIDVDGVGPKLRFFINGGDAIVESSTSLVQDTWYFAVCWHDESANTLNLRLDNGTPVSSSTGGAVPQTSSAEFRIGARQYSGFEGYMRGLIDEVGFWKRELDSSEQSELWNSGNGLAYSSFSAGGGSVVPLFMNQYRQRVA